MASRMRKTWKLLIGLGVLGILGAGTIVGVGMGGSQNNQNQKLHTVGNALDPNPKQVIDGGVISREPNQKPTSGPIGKPAPPDSASSGAASSSNLPDIPTDNVIKTGSVDLQLKSGQLKNSITELEKLVGGISGAYIQDSSTSTHESTFTVRVPAVDFEKTLSQLSKLGKVKATSANGDDVSTQFVDLDARLNTLQAHEARLLELMKTADVQTSLTIQDQIFDLQEQIDQAQGTKQLLQNQTSFGTLTVKMFEGNAAAKSEPTKPSILTRSWHTATAAFLTVVGGTLVVLSVVAPILLIAGALVLIIRWIVLMVVRKRQVVTP